MENYYEILNIMNFAEVEVINAAYKALAKKYHPDVNKTVDPKIMERINNAHDVLSKKETKEKYDIELKKFLDSQRIKKTINEYKDDKYVFEYVQKKTNIFRIFFSLVVGLLLSRVIGDILAIWLNAQGSWGYISYTISGYIIANIIVKISNYRSHRYALISTILVMVGMLSPYYYNLWMTLPLVYGEMGIIKFFVLATKETSNLLLFSGFIRMIFVVMMPMAIYGEISE